MAQTIFNTGTLPRAARTAAAITAILALAACGGVKDGASAGAATGTITVGTTDKINALDPAGTYSNTVQLQAFPFLYTQGYGHTEMDPDLAADDGTWNADGTTFTVKLKSGLKWANGHTLDSKDVKFSFDRDIKIADDNGPSTLLSNIESIDAPDATTVVFHAKIKNDVTLKRVLGSPAGAIVDDEVFAADKLTDNDAIVKANAFGGPYVITNYKVNELVQFKKNPNYAGLLPAQNDAVDVKYMADESNLKLAVQQHDIDVAYRTLSPTSIEDLRKDKDLQVITGPGGEERFLVFNLKLQPYGEAQSNADPAKAKAVRQAVADVIDRADIAKSVYKNTYSPLYSYIPNGLDGAQETFKSAFGDGKGGADVNKAKQTLAAAGVTTPVDIKLEYNGEHYGTSSADEYAAIKAQLEDSGLFTVDLKQTEWTQYSKQRVIGDGSDGSFPVYQLGWFPDYSDPDNYLSPIYRSDGFLANGYASDKLDQLITAQAAEQDASKRQEILGQIQDLITSDVPTIPLLQGQLVAVAGANVKGVTLDASFNFHYSPITKE